MSPAIYGGVWGAIISIIWMCQRAYGWDYWWTFGIVLMASFVVGLLYRRCAARV